MGRAAAQHLRGRTVQIRVTLTDAAARRLGHMGVDLGHRSVAETLRAAALLYADLGPALGPLRDRARAEGVTVGELVRSLTST